MGRSVLIVVLAFTAIQSYGALQVQMPETAELQHSNDDLQEQIQELQKNVSDVWTYVYDLRNAVSKHLTHLRAHQVLLESAVHRMEHLHEGAETSSNLHSDSHHHSSEQHSHGSDHSHGNDHSHSSEHSHGDDHSHSNDHSHGGDHGSDQHSHSGEHHSHSGEHHSHSGENHSHSGEQHSHSGEHGHHSESHSHSHTSHDHSKEDSSGLSQSHSHGSDDHHHHHDNEHKDSHETEDLTQQTQQVAKDSGPLVEPIVTATNRQEHSHDHGHSHSHSRSSSGRSNSMDLMNEHSFHSHHHHHHDDKNKNKTIELPKYADYNLYDFAICNVQPNRAISESEQQNVGGQITFWQKKSRGPLNIHIRVQGFAVGDHHETQQTVQQEAEHETHQEGGHKHGFHIHSSGDLSNGCQSTGPHYNPKNVNHGAPNALIRHVGDLGNIECDEHGVTNVIISDDLASLRGQYSIVGKAAVIHSNEDDLGLGGNAESLRTGNAGTRIACCIIEKVDKLPIRHYKAMKTAKQYKNA